MSVGNRVLDRYSGPEDDLKVLREPEREWISEDIS